MNSVKLEEIKDILTEEGFTIFGHGTGGNNIEAVGSIFDVGLRASHTSVFYTTIGLDVDNELLKFKEKLDHWPHLDSENIILIRLPNEFFNMLGDFSDLDCERTAAFVNEKIDEYGNIVYYLDSKFIIGAYNRKLSQVILNPNYEKKLSEETLKEMKKKLLIKIDEIKGKNKGLADQLNNLLSEEIDLESQDIQNFDINSNLDDLTWDDEFSPLKDIHNRSK